MKGATKAKIGDLQSLDDPADLEAALKDFSPRLRALFLRTSSVLQGLDEPQKSELGSHIGALGAITEKNADDIEALLDAYVPATQ